MAFLMARDGLEHSPQPRILTCSARLWRAPRGIHPLAHQDRAHLDWLGKAFTSATTRRSLHF